ncbi:MAG TPA: hypothetical protein VNN20_17060 [Thermodesulfobacteriota bacterium]|nr:hypothetical protein [Thermodesulfobacteriota bacterium]
MLQVKLFHKWFISSLIVVSTALVGCNDSNNTADNEGTVFSFDFSNETHGWVGGFADYPQGEEDFFELIFDHRELPENLDRSRKALFLSGNNHSDDLFMFLKREITGLKPDTAYLVDFEVEIASEAGKDCSGIGGSPAIKLKAGASIIEPVAEPDDTGFLMMNIDKGNQTEGGEDAQVLGDIGVDTDCANPVFQIKKIESDPGSLFEVVADETGSVWLIVGTDSGFEGTTNLFYTEIKVTFILR